MGYLDPNHAKLEDLMDPGSGPTLFVDTVAGSASGTGRSWESAYSTMALAFADLLALHTATSKSADNATIYARGDIREQITAPLGVSGVRIIGAVGGRPRHDNGLRWREAATAGDAPLLTLREQGWEVRNVLFVPQATYSAIRLRRQEDATYPDASHAIIRDCRFIGNITTPAGIGVEDYGGNSHVLIEDCEFQGLVDGYLVSNQGIDWPNMTVFRRNILQNNTNHFRGAQKRSVIEGNRFLNLGATTYINTEYGNVGEDNLVILNFFPDAAGDIKEDSGYLGNATDTWANYATGTAALIVESPPGAS